MLPLPPTSLYSVRVVQVLRLVDRHMGRIPVLVEAVAVGL